MVSVLLLWLAQVAAGQDDPKEVVSAPEPPKTALRLRFVNEESQPVTPKQATITFIFWGGTVPKTLGIEGNAVLLPLDNEWAARAAGEKDAPYSSHLYVEADGYAAFQTGEFDWSLPSRNPGEKVAPWRASVEIANGQVVVVEPGETREVTVTLRRPAEKWIRCVDKAGSPLQDVSVSTCVFGTNSNHCGVLVPLKKLDSGKTSPEGRFRITDGDVIYGIQVDYRGYLLVNPKPKNDCYAHEGLLMMRLPERETALTFHKQAVLLLRFRVTCDGKPLAGICFGTRMAGCCCGVCWGTFVSSNADGFIEVKQFWPEEEESVWLADKSQMNGNKYPKETLWEGNPLDWLKSPPTEIALDAKPAASS